MKNRIKLYRNKVEIQGIEVESLWLLKANKIFTAGKDGTIELDFKRNSDLFAEHLPPKVPIQTCNKDEFLRILFYYWAIIEESQDDSTAEIVDELEVIIYSISHIEGKLRNLAEPSDLHRYNLLMSIKYLKLLLSLDDEVPIAVIR